AEYIAKDNCRGERCLIDAFQVAHARVRQAASADDRIAEMGTTLVALLEGIDEDYIASVGDSRAYLFESGHLRQLTADQTWVNEIGRRIGIPEENLTTHPMRHVLTVAVGVAETLRVQTITIRPNPGALVLLCCDGLHGPVPESAIVSVLTSETSLEEKCKSL